MVHITLFGASFSDYRNEDDPRYIGTGVFVTTINDTKFSFFKKCDDESIFILSINGGEIQIRQYIKMSKLKNDTSQSYFQRAAKQFEKKYHSMNFEQILKLQVLT